MCRYKLEFTLPDGSTQRICIPQYIEIRPLKIDPDPPEGRLVQFDDLRVLATISELTASITAGAGIARELDAAVGTAMQHVAASLPQGMNLRDDTEVPAPC